METPSKHSRLLLVTEVIRLSNEGLSIAASCRQVGISRSSFYELCKKHPELIENLHEQIEKTARQQFALILLNRTEILEKLIHQALSDETKPIERMKVFTMIEKQLQSLVQSFRIVGGDEEAAKDVLSGPILVQGESRFAIESA